MSKYIGVKREGQEHPQVVGQTDNCSGVLRNLGVIEYINLLTDYILVHGCTECDERFYDAVDTIDGRIELA